MYAGIVMADRPTVYLRMGSVNTSESDLAGTVGSAFTSGTYTPGSTPLLVGDPERSILVTGNFISATNPSSRLRTTQSWSMECWVTLTSLSTVQVPLWIDSGPGVGSILGGLDFNSTGQHFDFTAYNASTQQTVTSSLTATTNTVYHLVGTYNASGNISLYINGVLDHAAAATTGTPNDASNMHIEVGCLGNNGSFSSDPWVGNIQEVAYYIYELTPQQILRHYLAGRGQTFGIGDFKQQRRLKGNGRR